MNSLSSLQSLLSEDQKNKLKEEREEKEKRDKQFADAKARIASLTIKEMNVVHFPVFVRLHYPKLRTQSNSTLIQLGEEFKKYLEEVFKGKLKKLEPIWDIDPKTVVWKQMTDPFSIKGYHPALMLHWCDFIDKMKKENPIK